MTTIEVAELKGYKSYRAFNVFHSLMLGLKMLPEYMAVTYEDFFKVIDELTPEDQEKMIRKAALFVKLEQEEIESLVCFCKDPKGVPYGPANVKNLGPDEILEIIVAVCVKISQIKIDLVSKAEKKNLKTTPLM